MARALPFITIALAFVATLAAQRSAGFVSGVAFVPLLLLILGLLPIGQLRLPTLASATVCYLLLALNFSSKGSEVPADVLARLTLLAPALGGAIHLLLGLRPLGWRSRALVMAGTLVVMCVLAFALVYAWQHADMSGFS